MTLRKTPSRITWSINSGSFLLQPSIFIVAAHISCYCFILLFLHTCPGTSTSLLFTGVRQPTVPATLLFLTALTFLWTTGFTSSSIRALFNAQSVHYLHFRRTHARILAAVFLIFLRSPFCFSSMIAVLALFHYQKLFHFKSQLPIVYLQWQLLMCSRCSFLDHWLQLDVLLGIPLSPVPADVV
jgi:hypothetical protein